MKVEEKIIDEIKRGITEIQEEERRTGESYFYATPKLQELAERYCRSNIKTIYTGVKKAFTKQIKNLPSLFPDDEVNNKTALSPEEIELITTEVTKNFAYNFFGVSDFNLTINGLYKVLKHVTPYKAYTLDKYAFYYPVMARYLNIMHVYGQYNKLVKQETATVEDIETFLKETPLFSNSHAVWWLVAHDYITLEELKGEKKGGGVNLKNIADFLAAHNEFKMINDVIVYYFIAKYVLQATPEELKEIGDLFKQSYILKIINVEEFITRLEEEAERLRGEIDETAEIYADAFRIEQQEEEAEEERRKQEDRRKRAEYAALRAEKWEYGEMVALYRPINSLLEGPILISTDKTKIENLKPIQVFIDKYNQLNGSNVTVEAVYKVIENIPRLITISKKKKYETRCEYTGTLSELAEMCEYQPNKERREELYHTLWFLHSNPITVNLGEPTQLSLIIVDRGQLGSGKIRLLIEKPITNSKRLFINKKVYNQLSPKNRRGLSEKRFFYQLINKTNKKERELIDEVFSLTEKIKIAEHYNQADKVKKIQDSHRANYSNYKKQIRQWFDNHKAAGLVEYRYKENKKGEGVYSWKVLRALTKKEEEKIKIMEKQDNEIVGEIMEISSGSGTGNGGLIS